MDGLQDDFLQQGQVAQLAIAATPGVEVTVAGAATAAFVAGAFTVVAGRIERCEGGPAKARVAAPARRATGRSRREVFMVAIGFGV
jgi:hypothetical protein